MGNMHYNNNNDMAIAMGVHWMNRPHFRTPYSEGCFRRNMEESVGLESLTVWPAMTCVMLHVAWLYSVACHDLCNVACCLAIYCGLP